MADKYDFVFIGGGHNGLTAACYLAKAGQKVIVFERRQNIGGGACTEEVTLPGFKHNLHSNYHGWIHGGPVYKELELEKYGCKYIFPDPDLGIVFSDGTSILQWRDVEKTVKEIEYFSKRDAETYRELHEKFSKLGALFMGGFYSQPIGPGAMMSQLEGTEEGLELLKMFLNRHDYIVDDYFETEQAKLLVLQMSTQAGNPSNMYGTGMLIPYIFSVVHTRPWGLCVGGSRMLAEAMVKMLEANGGKVVKNTPVTKILLDGRKAKGIKLSDGTEVLADKAIVSNTCPQETLLQLAGEENFDLKYIRKIKSFRPDELALYGVHWALDEELNWIAAEKKPEVNRARGLYYGHDTLWEFQDQFWELYMGKLPEKIGGYMISPTKWDSSQAPPGKHTAFIWNFTPPTNMMRKGPDEWDEVKEEYADRCEDVLNKYIHNFRKSILKRYIYSPRDIEREMTSMPGGCMMLGNPTLDQLGLLRPFPSLRPYRTAIDSLYMCGGHNHPTGGITAAPGYNCANAIAEDFKIKKWWKPFVPDYGFTK